MKKTLILFLLFTFFSCATHKYKFKDYTVVSIGAAKASSNAISKNIKEMKMTTCCEAASLVAIQNSQYLNSTTLVTGEREKFSVKQNAEGKLKTIGAEKKCYSDKNDYEECTCNYEFGQKIDSNVLIDIQNAETKTGWVSPHTYIAIVMGKASQTAIDRGSQSMRESSCIDNARMNSIAAMIFDLGKNNYKDTSNVNVSFRTPMIYIKSCISDNQKFESCSCDMAIYEDKLKFRLLDNWKDNDIK